eukprot:TRINITY_DN3131_c0_g1_i7.p1 TRINITY_DN3131_c0_g1~~TRINITY_DN3131_c0_g1_i7.p1  ORF type:complete len:119 (+),score=8.83 TRINITY_DN3131_c0_g1_i7:100-456(+)
MELRIPFQILSSPWRKFSRRRSPIISSEKEHFEMRSRWSEMVFSNSLVFSIPNSEQTKVYISTILYFMWINVCAQEIESFLSLQICEYMHAHFSLYYQTGGVPLRSPLRNPEILDTHQ